MFFGMKIAGGFVFASVCGIFLDEKIVLLCLSLVRVFVGLSMAVKG